MWVVVDVESDGPVAPLYSMVSFGAVIVEPGLKRTFKGLTAPISDNWVPEALAVSNISREQHLTYPDPATTMKAFDSWLRRELTERPTLISDNNSFDAGFINYYMHRYVGENYFGHSSRRLNDLYAGTQNDASATQGWKAFRRTKHTHDPLDDARGVAEALLEMKSRGLRVEAIPDARNLDNRTQ